MDSTSSNVCIHVGNLKPVLHRAAPKSGRLSRMLLAASLVWLVPGASADAPPGPYFNGFETDTAGWFNFNGATITRVPTGSSSTYANGVAAATGELLRAARERPQSRQLHIRRGNRVDLLWPLHQVGRLLGDLPAGRLLDRGRHLSGCDVCDDPL